MLKKRCKGSHFPLYGQEKVRKKRFFMEIVAQKQEFDYFCKQN
jgi:hypothetical protein